MFRHKKVNFLIVTDLAARGIDIPLLQNVIHYDFPASLKLYIHRSGRTARAGQKGNSYSIITQDELAYAYDLSVFVGKKLQDEKIEDQESAIANPEFLTIGSIP
jgi:ATP-dependent RNA helicase DDX54/DBP10